MTGQPATTRLPGVYRAPRPRTAEFPRARTDIVGFVGFAGLARQDEAVVCDGWDDFRNTFQASSSPVAGSYLSDTVRAYFANGGLRAVVVNVGDTVPPAPATLVATLFGSSAPGAMTGTHLLLQHPDVMTVAVPDLHAQALTSPASTSPPRGPSVFTASASLPARVTLATSPHLAPVLPASAHATATATLAILCAARPVRACAVVSPPAGLDAPTAAAWASQVSAESETDAASEVLLAHWPWVRTASQGWDARLPPDGMVAGLLARADLQSGPAASTANTPLIGAVGTEVPVTSGDQLQLLERGLNVIVPTPRGEVRALAARTLAFGSAATEFAGRAGLTQITSRRTISAIARTCESIGESLMFEPNVSVLRVQLTLAVTGYLIRLYDSGVFAGASPADSFFVRIASAPTESAVVCEVGVALAAPAEFIVFRLDRRVDALQLTEGAA